MWCNTSFQCFRSFELNRQPLMCPSSFANTTPQWLVSHEPNDLVFKLSNISDSILAQGNVCSTNFGNKVAFLANICNCKLRIFSPPHSHGVHIFSCDRSCTPQIRNYLEHQKFLMISELIFCVICFGQSIIIMQYYM